MFGTDLEIFPDLSLTRTVGGWPNLAGALARRFITPRGALWYAPGYGLDLRQYLNEALTPELAEEVRMLVEQECEKDPRVLLAEAELDVSAWPQGRLTVRVRVQTDEGPHELILGVDRVSVEVLNARTG